jgi:hypothetical protein
MKKQLRTFGLVNVIVSILFLSVAAWLFINRQTVVDWWRLQTYEPPAAIVALTDKTVMTDQGRNLFFASQPSIEQAGQFNQHCTNQHEQSIVLGCYRAQQIYLFDVTDERLSGVKEVTAAHEMLHAAYERLDNAEKQRVNSLLTTQLDAITDTRILGLIELYNQHNPSELYNEMHSILATEYRDLSSELETYYKQYFADRLAVVALSQKYESVFNESKKRIETMDAQLNTYKNQINTNNAELERRQVLLQAEAERLLRLRNQQRYNEYNQAIPGYNAQVRDFNALVEATEGLVSAHNELVKQRNNEEAAQANLYQSLDSRYQEVPQTN